MTGTRRRWVGLVQLSAASVIVISMLVLPALVTRVGTRRSDFTVAELPVLRWLVVVGVILVLATITDVTGDRPVRQRRALPPGVALLVGAVVGIVLVNLAATLVPDAVLPRTARRAGVSVHAGIGLWLIAVAAACVVLAASDRYRSLGRRVREATRTRERWLLAGASAIAVAIAVLRTVPWIDLEAVGQTVSVPGLGLPWIGALSLLCLWIFAVGVGAGFVVRHPTPILVAITASWVLSLLGALVVLTSGALGRAAALASVRGAGRLDAQVTAAGGAWAVFVAGTCGAALLLGVLAERGTHKPLIR